MPNPPKEKGLLPSPGQAVIGALLPLSLILALACGSSEGQARSQIPPAADPATEASSPQERLPPRGQAWVILGADTVRAEVARTPAERERGLMHRESLAEGRGMLFVFPDAQVRSFWMKDTFIPLDIAYFDENLRIINILAMEPETLDTYPSAAPAIFALEVPLGWFQKKGIEAGNQARIVFGPG